MSSLAQRVYQINPAADRAALGYCRRLPQHVDRDEIRHLAQIEALVAVRKFDGRGNLDAWVTQHVRWRLVDEIRVEMDHVEHCTPIEGDRWLHDQCKVTPYTAPDTAELYERSDTYCKALAALPPVTRSVVDRTLNGAAAVQIAREMGVTPSRVWQHLESAKRAFAGRHSMALRRRKQ